MTTPSSAELRARKETARIPGVFKEGRFVLCEPVFPACIGRAVSDQPHACTCGWYTPAERALAAAKRWNAETRGEFDNLVRYGRSPDWRLPMTPWTPAPASHFTAVRARAPVASTTPARWR